MERGRVGFRLIPYLKKRDSSRLPPFFRSGDVEIRGSGESYVLLKQVVKPFYPSPATELENGGIGEWESWMPIEQPIFVETRCIASTTLFLIIRSGDGKHWGYSQNTA